MACLPVLPNPAQGAGIRKGNHAESSMAIQWAKERDLSTPLAGAGRYQDEHHAFLFRGRVDSSGFSQFNTITYRNNISWYSRSSNDIVSFNMVRL